MVNINNFPYTFKIKHSKNGNLNPSTFYFFLYFTWLALFKFVLKEGVKCQKFDMYFCLPSVFISFQSLHVVSQMCMTMCTVKTILVLCIFAVTGSTDIYSPSSLASVIRSLKGVYNNKELFKKIHSHCILAHSVPIFKN